MKFDMWYFLIIISENIKKIINIISGCYANTKKIKIGYLSFPSDAFKKNA